FGEVYRSSDGGQTYTLVNTGKNYLNMQGWYDNTIWVDPTNSNTIIVGGIDLWRGTYDSASGSVTLTKISQWQSAPASAHADNHMIVESSQFNGSTNKTVYFGNDGGIYATTDVYNVGSPSLTSGWNSLNNGLGITQFYGGAGNPTSGRIVGGTQDNGTLRYTGSTSPWNTPFGGDGGFCAADPSDPNYFYGEYVYLQIHRSTNGGLSSNYIYNGITDWGGGSGANFIAPFILDPNNPNTMLAGGAHLWRSTNVKAATPTWASIKDTVGSNISAIAVASGNSDIVWVGHNNGDVYYTTNASSDAPTWTRADNGTTALPNRFCERIVIDPTNSKVVYVTFGGFSSSNVWRTTDGGATWTDITGNLPQAPVYAFAVWQQNPKFLYAGTEVGIFASADGGQTWSTSNDGPTNCSVDDLFWMNNTLVAVTHGRGMFSIPLSGGQLNQTITFGALSNRTFGDAPFTVNATASPSGLPVTFSILSGPATISGNTVMIKGAGTITIRASQAGDTTYSAATPVDQSFTVAKATSTVTWSNPVDIIYGTALSGTQLNATANIPGVFIYSPSAGTVLNSGGNQTLLVNFFPTDGANYINASKSVQINVLKADQTITFKALANRTFGDPNFIVSATDSSNLPVTFSATGNCTVSGNTLHITSAGSCTITASQAGNANFNAAPDASQTFTIAKATPVITWNDPANINSATPISSTQLNASANVPGTFSYSPVAGTTLSAGTYQLSANFTPSDTTNYNTASKTVQLTVVALLTVSFSSTTYSVAESNGNVPIIINRSGDTSAASSVNYATSDTAGLASCNQANTGNASSRCDYATTIGTLQFGAGETTKTIFIPIVNDSYAEGNESFTITLSSPRGATLGSNSTATITIVDDDATTGGNPIVDPAFFIRQQYIDFLGREPDPAGLAGWQSILNGCPASSKDAQGNFCDRIEVSAGFFRSPEFQDRGYFVFRFYPAALGRNPNYVEFMPDLAKVSGFLSDAQLEANKVAFVQDFMTRSEFQQKYGSLSDSAFHDALVQAVGVDPGIAFPQAGTTRAQFLRAFVESTAVYNKFFNQAFVVMQYFGYLRRDPDILYLNWIDTMNKNSGDYRTMINGFMNSSEYFLRFGP
ncbi:MAG TPA: Calx-beta domain-containing protein, partial [Pyrinomonadaceae bacterium]|nr:Calx-beta domain-containing protein [Pyrinomonadaceae bacterium]